MKTLKKPEIIVSNCKFCGKEIKLKRKWQKYCNGVCRWKDWSKNNPRVKQ